MSGSALPSVHDITAEHFSTCLERYPSCIKAISDAKNSSSGSKTLFELDQYRYGEALSIFTQKSEMDIDQVKTLVEWKLRRGKYRPTLLSLVASNQPKTVANTVRDAWECHDQEFGTVETTLKKPLEILITLRGIGPATASLLLAVRDPYRVIFFADEAFHWLCQGGKHGSIKYDMKEYLRMAEQCSFLMKRPGFDKFKAVDVEKVAFVLMRRHDIQDERVKAEVKREEKQTGVANSNNNKRVVVGVGKKKRLTDSGKRKRSEAEVGVDDTAASRRSQRLRRRV